MKRTIERRGWQWAPVPAQVITSQKLDAHAVRVYAYLLWRAGDKGQAWPSEETIAADLGMSRAGVYRALRSLVAEDWIIRLRRVNQSSVTLIFERQEDCRKARKDAPLHHGRCDRRITGDATVASQVMQVNQSHLTRTKEPEPTAAAASLKPVIQSWEANMGPISAAIADALNEAVKEYTLAWVQDAIKEAALAGVRRWKYVAAILERWKTEGRKSTRPASAAQMAQAARKPTRDYV